MLGPLQSGIFTLRKAAMKKPPVLSRWGKTRSSFAPSYCCVAIYKSRLSCYYRDCSFYSFDVLIRLLSPLLASLLVFVLLLQLVGICVLSFSFTLLTSEHVDIYFKTRCNVSIFAIPPHECNFTPASRNIAFTSNSSTLSLYVFSACTITFSFYSGFRLQVL